MRTFAWYLTVWLCVIQQSSRYVDDIAHHLLTRPSWWGILHILLSYNLWKFLSVAGLHVLCMYCYESLHHFLLLHRLIACFAIFAGETCVTQGEGGLCAGWSRVLWRRHLAHLDWPGSQTCWQGASQGLNSHSHWSLLYLLSYLEHQCLAILLMSSLVYGIHLGLNKIFFWYDNIRYYQSQKALANSGTKYGDCCLSSFKFYLSVLIWYMEFIHHRRPVFTDLLPLVY